MSSIATHFGLSVSSLQPKDVPPGFTFDDTKHTTTSGKLVSARKHEKFYFEDGNVMFSSEDSVLYHLHRCFFRESGLLIDDSESPVDLRDVQSHEFDAFLAIIYPSDYLTYELTSVDEWTSVLRLATLWGFESIRILAVSRLTPVASAIDKVILAHTYEFLSDWAVPGYVELCARPEQLSLDEARRLGIEDALFVCNMRETMRNSALLCTESEITARITQQLRRETSAPVEEQGDSDGCSCAGSMARASACHSFPYDETEHSDNRDDDSAASRAASPVLSTVSIELPVGTYPDLSERRAIGRAVVSSAIPKPNSGWNSIPSKRIPQGQAVRWKR
ncbi:hypothetical protein BV25DRAFT_1236557 [Artomyces pyxidatus]|uniref:Uncharacterized protein n=1 Tax=Artomyces pyxidatus TaxID=48021 RepID=A0ACB8SR56_9AGAM|nr:hypothetical protein BV25DRAFT_1236557 [Artomyces pyxidatus]